MTRMVGRFWHAGGVKGYHHHSKILDFLVDTVYEIHLSVFN